MTLRYLIVLSLFTFSLHAQIPIGGGSSSGGGGAGFTGSGTANDVTKFTGATALGNSSMVDDGTNPVQSPNGVTSMTNGFWDSHPNANPGTVLNKTVCYDSSKNAIVCPVSTVTGVHGVAGQGAGNSGSVQVCWSQCTVLFDNQSVVNHYAIPSTTVAGELHDNGTVDAAGVQNFLVDSANAGAGTTAVVDILSADQIAGSGGQSTTIQINGTGTKKIANFNGTTPAAGANNLNLTLQASNSANITSVSVEVPYASPLSVVGGNLTCPTCLTSATSITCNKYTVTQSPFGTTWTVTGQSGQAVTSSVTTQTINIVTLATKTVINSLRIATVTKWAGTSMTNITMSLGTNASGGSTTSFEPAFVVGGTSNTLSADSPFGACTATCPTYLDDGGSFSGADNGETVTATFISTGGNLTAMTAGSEDITLCTSVLP